MYRELPNTANIAVHIQEYKSEDNSLYNKEEDDINNSKKAIHYLTANAFLHYITGEDLTKYNLAELAKLFILED
jgi:CRISPR/Cas system CSM-associated protein Csm4 (group 5 of RAMP superfamily)